MKTNEQIINDAYVSLGCLNGYLSRMDGQNQIPREDFEIIVEWMQIIKTALNIKINSVKQLDHS